MKLEKKLGSLSCFERKIGHVIISIMSIVFFFIKSSQLSVSLQLSQFRILEIFDLHQYVFAFHAVSSFHFIMQTNEEKCLFFIFYFVSFSSVTPEWVKIWRKYGENMERIWRDVKEECKRKINESKHKKNPLVI